MMKITAGMQLPLENQDTFENKEVFTVMPAD